MSDMKHHTRLSHVHKTTLTQQHVLLVAMCLDRIVAEIVIIMA